MKKLFEGSGVALVTPFKDGKVNYEKFQGVGVAQEGKKTLKVDLLAKLK